MDDQTIIENEDFHRQFEQANGFRRKGVTPHHITTEEHTLGDILERARQLPTEPIQRVLDRVDASLLGADGSVYLRDTGVHNADLTGRLRHRATMLRQRADELDSLADLYEGPGIQHLRSAVETYAEQTSEIETLLRSYAHVNPTAIHN